MLHIAKVIGTKGLKGHIKLYPYTNMPQDIERVSEVYIGEKNKYSLSSCKLNKNILVVKLDGIENIEAAEKLKNMDVYIAENEIDAFLGDDTFFYEDLIGFEIKDEEGNVIGKLSEIKRLPKQDVLVIKDSDREWMLPFIDEFITAIDSDNKVIEVKLIKGMYDEA